MVYHSAFNESKGVTVACGCAVLPLKTAARGPAPRAEPEAEDIIDETLGYFKANVLFKHFEVKGCADRVLIYLTLYTTQCLKRLESCPRPAEGLQALTTMAHEDFTLPGDANFALGSFFPSPASEAESDLCRAYLKQAREELGKRLVQRVYDESGSPSKFWLVFAKRKFMNKQL